MGEVYRAIDERFQVPVAIKRLIVHEPELVEAFEREARLLKQLRHPNIPTVSDYFSEDGAQFLVMDFIEGDTLGQRLEAYGKPLPVDEVLIYANQLCTVLAFLHGQTIPIIHRDIKPDTIKRSTQRNIFLIDFGLESLTRRVRLPRSG